MNQTSRTGRTARTRRLTRRGAIAALSLVTARPAWANEDTIDMSRAVFVALAGSNLVPFIDPDTDQIAGTIDTGLVPKQLELAAQISKLLAIDGTAARVNLIDLVTRQIDSQPLNLVPDRMTVSGDGLTAALADCTSGRVVLLDLLRHRTLGSVPGPAPLRDLVFSADSRTLYLSGGNAGAIGAVDASTAYAYPAIVTGLSSAGGALTRAPNGRRLFVQSNGAIGVLDLERRQALPPIRVGPDPTVPFPSATGAYLLIADNRRGTLTVLRDGTATPAVLKAATGVNTIYTAWFDTLALVPSTTAQAVLLYDLDAIQPAGAISLAAAPGRGAVTPDGQKLYLPLPDARQIAVIDARHRTLAASAAVPGSPSTVLLAGSYGICH